MDQYQKLNLIGKGNFGTVNLYERIFDKKQFAIKKTFFKQGDNHQPLNEIKILESINHPNIIKYYDSFIYNNKIIIVMEYACQGDLQKFLKEFKQQKQYINEEKIIEFINQLVSALSYLQEKKIIHRDIKLQNILVDKNGILKLGDFGISKQLDQSNELAKTSLGTPYYLSPEICQNQQYDHQNDMWMLGCALYELTAQEKPFQGDSLNAIINNIMNNQPKSIPEIYSNFIQNIIFGLLDKKPDKRITIQQLKIQMDNYNNKEIKTLIQKFEFKQQDNQNLQDIQLNQKEQNQIQNQSTTNNSDALNFKKKMNISILTQNLSHQKTRPESDKYGMLKNETEDIYNNRPKTFSFGKQLFNGFTPTSFQRKILLKEFLKKRLGDYRYQQIFDLINQNQSPLEFINEENQELINLLGAHNIDSIKCFQILFQQPQQNENKKFNFQNYKF